MQANSPGNRFDELFAAYYQSLVAYVTRLVVRIDVAEDIAVDAFVALHNKPDRWISDEDARRFLYRVAHNSALDELRTITNRGRLMQEMELHATTAGLSEPLVDPLTGLEEEDALRALDAALQSLPPQRRSAVTLRLEHGMKNAEIAAIMQISVKTVELHLSLAVKELRDKLASFRED